MKYLEIRQLGPLENSEELVWHSMIFQPSANFFHAELVRQVSDWCSGAAADFGWIREAKRENTRCSL
jgi:hypothetical protein